MKPSILHQSHPILKGSYLKVVQNVYGIEEDKMGYLLLLASRNIIINVVVGIFGGSFLSNVPRTTYEVPIPVKIPLLKITASPPGV